MLLVITTVRGSKCPNVSMTAATVNEINATKISFPFKLTSGLWDLIDTRANIIPDIIAVSIKRLK